MSLGYFAMPLHLPGSEPWTGEPFTARRETILNLRQI